MSSKMELDLMSALYAYIDADFNKPDVLVLADAPCPEGFLCKDLPVSPAPYLDLPEDEKALEQKYPKKFWAKIRHLHNRLQRDGRSVTCRIISTPEEMQHWLPKARDVFMRKWEDDYTSCRWMSEEGFREVTESLVRLASAGKAELAVAFVDDELVCYGVNILHDNVYYHYHHAVLPDEVFRPYSVGRILYEYMIRDAVRRGFRRFDFMQGEGFHKAFWTQTSRTVYYRVSSPRTVPGYLMHWPRIWLARLKIGIQNSPYWKQQLKKFFKRVQKT